MIPKISCTTPIRCLETSYQKISKSGLPQQINEYATKNGKRITEIITDLGRGKQGIREIFSDSQGKAQKVVDNIFGRIETYTTDGSKVIQETDDGVCTHLPANYWDYLIKI